MTVIDLFTDTVIRNPNKTALIGKDRSLSYSELLAGTRSLASGLIGRGMRNGERAGIVMRNSVSFVEILYALHMCGAVAVPFNFRISERELISQLEYSGCKTVFFDASSAGIVRSVKSSCSGVKNWISVGCDDADPNGELSMESLRGSSDVELQYPSPEDPAIMLFTGGTTGKSKLAVHTHMALYNWVVLKFQTPRRFSEDDIFLMSLPLCHSAGMGMLHDLLSSGATAVVTDKFDAASLLKSVEQYRITQLFMIPPSLCGLCVREQRRLNADISSVRIVSLAGGGCSRGLIEEIFELFPDAGICMVYSHTERAVFTMLLLTHELYLRKPWLAESVGKPYLGTHIKLIGLDGSPAAVGEAGILWARSQAQMSCYLNREESYEDGWLDTGDILRIDEEGYYYFLSRAKDCIKTGGENVFASELEAVIRRFPGVSECAVFGVPDEVYTEAVAAAIITDYPVSAEQIIAHCKSHLASFKKPRKIWFVDSMPRTGIGKVDKAALRALLSGREPDFQIQT